MTKTYTITKAFEMTPEGADKACGWDLFINDNWAQRFATKAKAKAAQIEDETQTIEAAIAAEKLELPALTAENILERAEIAQHNADVEATWVDPVKWIEEPQVDDLYIPLKKPMKVVKTVKTGVGQQILMLIAQGVLSNKEILAKVLEDNPARKTSYACVAWYQSQVKAGKIDLPEVEEEITGEYEEDLDENGNVIELDQEWSSEH